MHVQEAGRIPGRTAGFGASETGLSLSAGTGPFMGKPGGARGAWGHHTWGRDDQLPSFQPRGILGHLPCQTPGIHPWVGKVLWRRKWQPTPVFLSGESHGQRSLVGYSPQGHKPSDTIEHNILCPRPCSEPFTEILCLLILTKLNELDLMMMLVSIGHLWTLRSRKAPVLGEPGASCTHWGRRDAVPPSSLGVLTPAGPAHTQARPYSGTS